MKSLVGCFYRFAVLTTLVDVDHALCRAAAKGLTALTRDLLLKGASVQTNNYEPLRKAARNGHAGTVRVLLNSGAPVKVVSCAMGCAAVNGHAETVRALLDSGADIHIGSDRALTGAAANGHLETVNLLLERGADVHANNDWSIWWAARNGETKTVCRLLQAGADPVPRDAERWAWIFGHDDTAIILRDYIRQRERTGPRQMPLAFR